MSVTPRFGLRVIPAHKINVTELHRLDDLPETLQSSLNVHGLWQPLLVEVLQEDEEYMLVDGHRRYNYLTQQLGWKIVECIVTPETSHTERRLKHLGMHTFNQRLLPYEVHSVIYFLKKAGVPKEQIIEYSSLSKVVTQKYINATVLPLRQVLIGQEQGVGYDGWIQVLSIPKGTLNDPLRSRLHDAILNKECFSYQIPGIIQAITSVQFQTLTDDRQSSILEDLLVSNRNLSKEFTLSAAESVGLIPPSPRKATFQALNGLKITEKMMQPYVLNYMDAQTRQQIHSLASDILSITESWMSDESGYKGQWFSSEIGMQ